MSVPRLRVNTSSSPKPVSNTALVVHSTNKSCLGHQLPRASRSSHTSTDTCQLRTGSLQTCTEHVRYHSLSSARHPGALVLNAMCQMHIHQPQSERLSLSLILMPTFQTRRWSSSGSEWSPHSAHSHHNVCQNIRQVTFDGSKQAPMSMPVHSVLGTE